MVGRPLPAVELRLDNPVPVGHYTVAGNSEKPCQGWRYRALLCSEPHYRYPTGYWSGGGPFWAEQAVMSHQGSLEVPNWRYVNELGPTRLMGVSRLYAMNPPAFGSVKSGQIVGSRVIDAQVELRNLQGANYTKGILRTRPGQSEAGVGQFLAELKDLPRVPGGDLLRALKGVPLRQVVPTILSQFRKFLSLSAGEYLNYEFGWRPFVNDLQQTYRLAKRIDTAIQVLVANNHKNLRRYANLGVERVTTQDYNTPATYGWPGYDCGGFGAMAATSGLTYLTGSTTTWTKTWFVAGYRYDIPDTSSWLWKGKAVAVLFGVFPTPDLLYNITPWTWLADWFTDVGDIVAYFSPNAVENLVTRYAFTMRHVVRRDECVAHVRLDARSDPLFTWPAGKGVLRSLLTQEIKQRGHGWAPFGTSWPGAAPLTVRQKAILAALGISRAAL